MPYITLIAIVAVVLFDFIGAIPNSSVGGPLTLMLIVFVAMVAMGIADAWSHRRGVLGWIVSLVTAIVGGFAGATVAGMVMEFIIPSLQLDGSLAEWQHPFRYLGSAGMMILVLFGSRLGLWLVNRVH